jgi:glycosyltransferase involved in cell wall biosynthesis
MIEINEILTLITGPRGTAGLVLVVAAIVLLGADLWFWVHRYGRLSKWRNRRRQHPATVDGISVVVVLGDDFVWLDSVLPQIMEQSYPNFELVVIEVASSPEFSEALQGAKIRYDNITSARIDPDPRFRISDKMIYNIGVKTARYRNVILMTPDTAPASGKWLECMAKGFADGDVVVGYCGLQPAKGFVNAMMRCSRLSMSIRYLASAIAGRTYRGLLGNIGFTKSVYLENRGFNHLDMTIGEDDLFIQKIASRENVSIVLNRHATVRETLWGGLRAWWRRRRLSGRARDIYPAWAKRAVSMELIIRTLFMATVAGCALWMPLYTGLGALGLWLIRLFVVRHQVARISRRLGEKGLATRMMLWDIFEPLVSLIATLSQSIRPAREVWK